MMGISRLYSYKEKTFKGVKTFEGLFLFRGGHAD